MLYYIYGILYRLYIQTGYMLLVVTVVELLGGMTRYVKSTRMWISVAERDREVCKKVELVRWWDICDAEVNPKYVVSC